MGRPIRILCTGDLHVGRRPSRIGQLVEPGRCSCAAMFGEVVEWAIKHEVDAVAISGDLVDKANKFHEAYGPVERGLSRLARAGIDVFAVAGNHDFDVLPRLAAEVGTERFHLVGPNGTWGRATLEREGKARLGVVGWSFPAERVAVNPMLSFARDERGPDGVPVLGLLHADLDQPASPYAPVMLGELQSAPVHAWLLGHVHKPRLVQRGGAACVLYPGSPQAMDPGETGTHGPWLVEFDAAHRVAARQIPLSLVRYDAVDVDLTGVESKEAFDAVVPRRLREALAERCVECGPMELCSVRVRLTGTTRIHRQLKAFCQELREQLDLQIAGFRVRVEQLTIDTTPPADLRQLAAGSSVVADLAKLLLQLDDAPDATRTAPDGDAEAARSLLAKSADLAEAVCAARAYQPLSLADDPPPDGAAARRALRRQGMLLLDALRSQKSDPGDERGAMA